MTLLRSRFNDLRRLRYEWLIRRDRFASAEPEFGALATLVEAGDWVLDIGANVGHYARELSRCVGPSGRVIAFEPIPETFELLTSNSMHFPYLNVTALNLAASDSHRLETMCIPRGRWGKRNAYRARLAQQGGEVSVLCCPVDSFFFPRSIALAKIDTEGHEEAVLAGMRRLLERDRPHLIIEATSERLLDSIRALGYDGERLEGSPNLLCRRREG